MNVYLETTIDWSHDRKTKLHQWDQSWEIESVEITKGCNYSEHIDVKWQDVTCSEPSMERWKANNKDTVMNMEKRKLKKEQKRKIKEEFDESASGESSETNKPQVCITVTSILPYPIDHFHSTFCTVIFSYYFANSFVTILYVSNIFFCNWWQICILKVSLSFFSSFILGVWRFFFVIGLVDGTIVS